MLPHAYGLPAAVALVLGGALACFMGHRLFRVVLAIYGFILGSMLAAAFVGGLIGAIVLVMAYFVGIALIGAGLGALIGHAAWGWLNASEPPLVLVIVVSLVGAAAAMLLQRYVIIAGTAFAGAWTMIVGLGNILARRGVTRGASATEVWILYPTSVPDSQWAPYVWLGLSLVGLTVQLAFTSKRSGGKRRGKARPQKKNSK